MATLKNEGLGYFCIDFTALVENQTEAMEAVCSFFSSSSCQKTDRLIHSVTVHNFSYSIYQN